MGKTAIIGILLIFYSLIATAQSADDIIGSYHLPNDLDIEIYKQNNKYYGKIIALNNFENGQIKDVHNPDRTKQNELLVGKVIIHGLVFNSQAKQWNSGTIYSPEKGIVLDYKIISIDEKTIEIVGSKYFFWKTMKWVKL
jgi:hypothetical protein